MLDLADALADLGLAAMTVLRGGTGTVIAGRVTLAG
jgi:hypothetical protein